METRINTILSKNSKTQIETGKNNNELLSQEIEKLKNVLKKTKETTENITNEELKQILLDNIPEDKKEFLKEELINEIILSTETQKITLESEKIAIEQNVIKEFKQLGINEENLQSIENFTKLSEGQQLLVCENLKQLTLGRIQEEAKQKFHEGISKSRFLGRIWKNITKNFQIMQAEKNTVKEIQAGGMRIHEEILKQLVDGMKNFGPEVEIRDNNLEIQYVSLTDFENLTSLEQKMKVYNFNKIATEYSKMPYEWSLETADKNKQKKYKETEKRYEKAKCDILNLKEQQSSDQKACLYFNEIEGKIKINQFLNTHPDVEEQLKKIEDGNTYIAALKNVITERGIYFGLGFTARSIAVGFIGFAAAPLVAAGFGGWLARRRAKETLNEKELLSRKGGKDSSKEAKNFINADQSIKKLDDLIRKIEQETNPEKKQKLVNSLEERIVFTEDKIDQGLVNFGAKNERLKNQYDIISKLSEANINFETNNDSSLIIKKKIKKKDILLREEEKIASQRLEELDFRLNKFLNSKEQKISKERQKYLTKKMLLGAGISAGSAFAGVLFRHFLSEWWTGKQIDELGLVDKVKKSMRDVFGSAIDLKEGKLLADLNELLKDISQEQKGKIVLGLIQDKELNIKDLKFLNNLLNDKLNNFSPKAKGLILSTLAENGFDSNDSTNIDNLKTSLNNLGFTDATSQEGIILSNHKFIEDPDSLSKLNEDLNTLGITDKTDKMRFVEEMNKGEGGISDGELKNVSSAADYFSTIKSSNPGLANALKEKMTEDKYFSDADVGNLKNIFDFLKKNQVQELTPSQQTKIIEQIGTKELLNEEKLNSIIEEGQQDIKDVLGKLEEVKGVEITKDDAGNITSAEISIGGKEGCKYLDQALRRIVGGMIPDKYIVEGKINAENLGKVENALANLRNLITGEYKEIGGVKAGALKDVISFENNKLIIKNPEELNKIIGKLYEHSEGATEKPGSLASAFAGKTSEEVWKEEILPKGTKITNYEEIKMQAEQLTTPEEKVKPVVSEESKPRITPEEKVKLKHPFLSAMEQEIPQTPIPIKQTIPLTSTVETLKETQDELTKANFSPEEINLIKSIIKPELNEKAIDFLIDAKKSSNVDFLEKGLLAIKIVNDNPGCNIPYKDAYKYLPQLEDLNGNSNRMEGVVDFLNGKSEEGLNKIFGIEVNKGNYTFKNGMHNIDLKNGYHYVVEIKENNKINFGVKGPNSGFSVGMKKSFFGLRASRPIWDLTNDNIDFATQKIKDFKNFLDKEWNTTKQEKNK